MKPIIPGLALAALMLTTGCPENETILPDIVIDYGFIPDPGHADTALPDLAAVDNGVADSGRDTGADTGHPADVVEDTGPCTLICPATLRCGPHPCGVGECEPGCSGAKPVCNLETRQCEPEVCTPNCTGKVCGYDGCGGTCPAGSDGRCTGGLYCNYTTGQCEDKCYPDCTGRECGDDGCGKTCQPGCPSGVECHADGYCVAEGECQASSTQLECTADGNSATGDTSWNLGTTTSSLFNYSAECGGVFNPGPEKAYRLVVPANAGGLLEVDISQTLPLMATFLNVYLIEDSADGCLAANCVAAGSNAENLKYQVPASASGHSYLIVADAGVRNNGTFTITIKKCGWNGFDDDAVVAADE